MSTKTTYNGERIKTDLKLHADMQYYGFVDCGGNTHGYACYADEDYVQIDGTEYFTRDGIIVDDEHWGEQCVEITHMLSKAVLAIKTKYGVFYPYLKSDAHLLLDLWKDGKYVKSVLAVQVETLYKDKIDETESIIQGIGHIVDDVRVFDDIILDGVTYQVKCGPYVPEIVPDVTIPLDSAYLRDPDVFKDFLFEHHPYLEEAVNAAEL